MEKKTNFRTVQKLVPIVCIETNPWNPNVQEDKVFKKLIQSIKENGFTGAILVRTIGDQKYQIIDGEHRYRACRELGYDSMKVEDMGEIDDGLAKTLTILLNNLRGQDDITKRAEILKALNEGQKSLFPWSKEEIENEIALVDFDWNKYNKEEKVEEKKDHTICFALTKAQFMVVKHTLELTKKDQTMALLELCKEYLPLHEDISKYKSVFYPEEVVKE